MKKLGIYVRVSTEEQAKEDRYSIPIQKEMGRKFAEAEGFDYEIFEDNKSGGSVDRAGWQSLFEQVEAGEIDGIWIAKVDRFSRNTRDGLAAVDTMRRKHCRFWVNSAEYDVDDPNTEFIITMQFAFAAYERTQIKARTIAGRRRAKDEGLSVNIDMMGWDRIIGPDGKRAVRLNTDEAKIVQLIFSEYLSGKTIPYIQRMLVDAGIKGKYSGKSYRYKNGQTRVIEDRWQYSTIQQILSHPEYAGLCWDSTHTKLIESKRYTTKLVTKEEWDRAQDRIKARRSDFHPKTGNKVVTHFGSGLLFCKDCGAKYYYVRNRRQRIGREVSYYYYSHKRLTPVQRNCPNSAQLLILQDVEDVLSIIYLDLFSNTKTLKKIFDHQVKSIIRDKEQLERAEAKITQGIAENQKKIRNFLNAIAEGIDIPEIKTEIEKVKLDNAKLEAELRARQREYRMKTSDNEEVLRQFSKESIARFIDPATDGDTKRGIMLSVTKNILVTDKPLDVEQPVKIVDGKQVPFGLLDEGSPDAWIQQGEPSHMIKRMEVETIDGNHVFVDFAKFDDQMLQKLEEYRNGTGYSFESILQKRHEWDEYLKTIVTFDTMDEFDEGKAAGRWSNWQEFLKATGRPSTLLGWK